MEEEPEAFGPCGATCPYCGGVGLAGGVCGFSGSFSGVDMTCSFGLKIRLTHHNIRCYLVLSPS